MGDHQSVMNWLDIFTKVSSPRSRLNKRFPHFWLWFFLGLVPEDLFIFSDQGDHGRAGLLLVEPLLLLLLLAGGHLIMMIVIMMLVIIMMMDHDVHLLLSPPPDGRDIARVPLHRRRRRARLVVERSHYGRGWRPANHSLAEKIESSYVPI